MAVLFSDTVSGADIVDLSGPSVIEAVIVEVTTQGRLVKPASLASDRLLRVGYVAVGDSDPADVPAGVYWHAPLWCDFVKTIFDRDADFGSRLWQHFRYDFTDGTEVTLNILGTTPAAPGYAIWEERYAQNTAGVTFTSGAWRTRALNTEVLDASGIGSLASSQVTVGAGTYRFRGRANALGVDGNMVRLQNITAGTTLGKGMSGYYNPAASVSETNEVVGEFTVAGTTVLELQHRCQTTKTTQGQGAPSNVDVETYAQLEVWKVS